MEEFRARPVCTRCSAETTDTATLVPSGTRPKVICPSGHVTNGIPPLGVNGRLWIPITGKN